MKAFLGEGIDAINHLHAQGALPTVTEHLRVLFYCTISNGLTGIASIVNMHDGESILTSEELIRLQKEVCNLTSFNPNPASSPLPRFQYESVSRKMWAFFLNPIVEKLLLECEKIRKKYKSMSNFTQKKKDKIYDDIIQCVDKTMETLWNLEENRNAFAKAHPELNMSRIKNSRKLKALPANLLMNFLACFEYIPRVMITYARYGKDEGPAKCMDNLSTLHLSRDTPCYNTAAKKIRLELNEKFDLEVTDAQLENYLCEIYRMFSKIPPSISVVGDWKKFGKRFIESESLATSCIEWWCGQSMYQEKHHFNLHRGSLAHLFRMKGKHLVIRDCRSSNRGNMTVKFAKRKVKKAGEEVNEKYIIVEIKGMKNNASFEDYYRVLTGASTRKNDVLRWLKKEPFSITDTKKRNKGNDDNKGNKQKKQKQKRKKGNDDNEGHKRKKLVIRIKRR